MNQGEKIQDRRKQGRFFTHSTIADVAYTHITQKIRPDFILEPCVGIGSLIHPFLRNEQLQICINDINEAHVKSFIGEYKEHNIRHCSLDFLSENIDEILRAWLDPKIYQRILLYTNPPFGTSSTNAMVITQQEKNVITQEQRSSRQLYINYGGLARKYGKGDLCIPIIGKMMEIIRNLGAGYIAFYCPMGVFCGRKRYNRLLMQLLKDFEFLEGEIFSGKDFEDVNKDKPIALTLWRYVPNINTPHDALTFLCEGARIPLKKAPLLKDGWRYRDGNKYVQNKTSDYFSVMRGERFNTPNPKVFTINVIESSGAEIHPDNVKRKLNIPGIPDELFYALWSITVGYHSITGFPYYINEAYTHLPDFFDPQVNEILTLSVLFALIDEKMKNYTKGLIRFQEAPPHFRFGNNELTKACHELFIKQQNLKLSDNQTIRNILQELINQDQPSMDFRRFKKLLKENIEYRLKAIGYWNFIPIPNDLDS